MHIPFDTEAVIERYSDSAASYVILDASNMAVYKQLYRAAKAKSKLKLRVTVPPKEAPKEAPKEEPEEEPEEGFPATSLPWVLPLLISRPCQERRQRITRYAL